MNYEKITRRWVEAKIIDDTAAARIIQFEHERPSASWVMYGVTGIGVTVVSTGIISIIAANWDQISDLQKLSAYFIFLAICGSALINRAKTPGIVREALLTFFAGMILAGEGLIGQIYHLQSDGYSAIFLWLALILPLTFMSQSQLINHIWFAGMTFAMCVWNLENTSFLHPNFSRMNVTLAVPYIFLGLGYGAGHLLPYRFSAAMRIWSYGWLLAGWATFGNFIWADDSTYRNSKDFGGSILPVLAAITAITGVIFRKIQPGRNLTIAIIFTLSAISALTIPSIMSSPPQGTLIGCFLFILSWGGAAAVAAMNEEKRLFDFAAMVIGIRFIVVYFEVFGSLAATGFGLILSGTVILSVTYLWHRYRGKVARRVKEI